MFYLTTHSTHFIYGYMASVNDHSDSERGNPCVSISVSMHASIAEILTVSILSKRKNTYCNTICRPIYYIFH